MCADLRCELVDSIESRDANMFTIEILQPRFCEGDDSIIPYHKVVTLGQILHIVVGREYKVQIIVSDCYAISIKRNFKDPKYDEIVEVELSQPTFRRRHSSDQIN